MIKAKIADLYPLSEALASFIVDYSDVVMAKLLLFYIITSVFYTILSMSILAREIISSLNMVKRMKMEMPMFLQMIKRM